MPPKRAASAARSAVTSKKKEAEEVKAKGKMKPAATKEAKSEEVAPKKKKASETSDNGEVAAPKRGRNKIETEEPATVATTVTQRRGKNKVEENSSEPPAKVEMKGRKKVEKKNAEAPAKVANGTSGAKQPKKGEKETVASKEEEVEEVATTSKPTARATRGKKVHTLFYKEASDEETEEAPAPKRKGAKAKDESEPKGKSSKAAPTKNPTVTDWAKIDFTCTAISAKGASPNFHITTWNVDGIRAWLKKDGLTILQYDKPDIFCLQETKCSEDKLPDEVTQVEGYEAFWCASKKEGYAGVGIFTKTKPLEVIYGIDSEEHDEEGRCITAEFEDFFLVNVYVPNAGRKLVTLPKRLEWNDLFKKFIKDLDKKKPVIICGDMNVAHTEIDLTNPKTNVKNAGFTVEEREGMTDFLQSGFVDSYRHLYPDKENAYTFWSYMSNARAKNVGWRLDYFIVSERFLENVCDNVIHADVLGSDHCPVSLYVNI